MSSTDSILKGCTIRNGELILNYVGLSNTQLQNLTEKLYSDLVNYQIRHGRVVALSITDNGRVPESIIGNINGLNMTYVGLMDVMSKIILSQRHGNFYSPDIEGVDSVKDYVPFAEQFGHVMITEQRGEVTTSDGLRYFGETNVPVECLTQDEYLCTCHGHNVQVYAYYAFGTGVTSFEDNNKIFKRCRNIVPCRTVYDLTDAVMVKPWQFGDTHVKFVYRKPINEKVLTEIISNHHIVV